MLGKYKYYFKKPRSEISKDILKLLINTGVVIIASTSPSFTKNLLKSIKNNEYLNKKISNTFNRFKKQGLLEIEKNGHDLHISLSEKGKVLAGYMQIDALKIERPKKWDGLWRILIFDINNIKNNHRNALRTKLKNLDFFMIQKSVWVCPFNCRDEINILKDFFGLNEKEMRLIITNDIGDDKKFKKIFKITN